MSKRYQRARWVLPSVVAPDTSTCWLVPVPDDPMHGAAFRGALQILGSAASWANDDDHTALQVAAVWRDIADNLQECEMIEIRLKPTDFCTVQLSTDGGETWTDVADLSACAHAAAVDEIEDAIARGQLSGGGQQPAGGSGDPGVCYDYDVVVRGNDRWHSPIPVETGDIITIVSSSGAWWDGDVIDTWECPDATSFLLGACVGSPFGTDSADPLNTSPHGILLGNIDGAATPFFEILGGYTVPVGVAPSEFYLQMNDSVLTDNQGSINVHIQICKSLWTHTFDFLAGNGGFSVFNPTYSCQWTSGIGWETTSAEPGMDIRRTVPADCGIIFMELFYNGIAISGGDYLVSVFAVTGGVPDPSNGGTPAAGLHSIQATGSAVNPDTIGIVLIPGHTGSARALSLVVRGTGFDPF